MGSFLASAGDVEGGWAVRVGVRARSVASAQLTVHSLLSPQLPVVSFFAARWDLFTAEKQRARRARVFRCERTVPSFDVPSGLRNPAFLYPALPCRAAACIVPAGLLRGLGTGLRRGLPSRISS